MDTPGRFSLVVAADRLPTADAADGRPTADLAAAAGRLLPAVAARRGAWVGWTGDPDSPDAPARPDLRGQAWLHPVRLSRQEAAGYDHGQCASTLAPLYHGRVEPPVFRRSWSDAYRVVNRRFAHTVAAATAPGGVAWVHDYHLQLVPGHLRRWRPDLTIGFLMHHPFPPVELFLQLPTRAEILAGLLGADLVAFPDPRAAANFLELARQVPGLRTHDNAITVGDRLVRVGVHPTSIDVDEVERTVARTDVQARVGTIRAGLHHPRTVFLAVNHLTHAAGVEQHLDAYAQLLADSQLDPAHTILIEVAVPDRQATPHQQHLAARVDRQVAQINGTHATVGRPVIHYLRRDLDLIELVALYVAADAMLAAPLHGGASLAAKEFVAARTDHTGQLILSDSVAAATDLPGAIIVNPHDTDALAAAMLAAAAARRGPATTPAMRARLRRHDIFHHAERFLDTLDGCAATREPRPHRRPRLAGQIPARPPSQTFVSHQSAPAGR